MGRITPVSGRLDVDQKGTSLETIQVGPEGMTGRLQGNCPLYAVGFLSEGKERQQPKVGNCPVEWHCGDLSGVL